MGVKKLTSFKVSTSNVSIRNPLKSTLYPTLLLGAGLLLPSLAVGDKALKDYGALEFSGAETQDEKVSFLFDMGTKRSNWTKNKWSVMNFAQVADLSAYDGITLKVSTDQPRRDVGVYVAIREADKTWYAHAWACELTQNSNEATIRFADFATPAYSNPPQGGFKDENDRLDVDKIDGIAIGVINPLGVGEVSFTLEALRFTGTPKTSAEPVKIDITGEFLDVNGTTMIAPGTFGSFNLKSIPTGGQSFIKINEQTIPVVNRKFTYEGQEYTLDRRNRVRIKMPGQKKPKRFTATVPSMLRAEKFRMGSDRTIQYGMTNGIRPGTAAIPMMINSYGDRTQPPIRLSANWKEQMEQMAKNAANAASKAQVYVEFWNEPYLNWANDNRKGFNPANYDISKAKEGGPVHIKHDGAVVPHLKWTKKQDVLPWDWNRYGKQEFRRGRDEKGRVTMGSWARPYQTQRHVWAQKVKDENPPDNVKDGETYTGGNGKTYTAFTPWTIYDETQFTYWSGKGMSKLYDEPLVAFAKSAKEKAGDKVTIIAGWGNRPSEDHWAGFFQLYKPTIDASWQYIDGINDHDYGGSPIRMPANYEVVNAYSVNTYRNPLTFWNTETASNMDPQAHGGEIQMSGDAMKFQWVTRKVAQALDAVPDKIRNFSHFGLGGGFWSDGGEGKAFDMMRELRGRLLYADKQAGDVYVVAGIDGTDPIAPRGELGDKHVFTAMIINDHLLPREAEISINAPAGASFAESGRVRVASYDWASGKPDIKETSIATDGKTATLALTLESRAPVVVNIPLTNKIDPATPATVKQVQHLHKAVLHEVTAEAPATAEIEVPEASKAKRATLRLVVERLAAGEGQVVINGKTIALPATPTPEGNPLIVRIPLDTSILKSKNTVSFEVTDANRAGFLLGMASIDTIE